MPVTVALVRPRNPGNLGSAARAARNFGAALALLDPRCGSDHPDALAYASGAEGTLRGAALLASWEELEKRADVVLALTALRGRKARGLPPAWTWAAARREVAAGRRLVLVFGPERAGLTTEELRRAAGRLSLPASPEFPTLNLAQAVAASLALIASGRSRTAGRRPAAAEPLASAAQLARLTSALRTALAASGYTGRPGGETVVAELSNVLVRGRPTARDVTLWLGALGAFGALRVLPDSGSKPG